MPDISELQFTRIVDIQLIPRELFEQVDGLDENAIDLIYSLGAGIFTIPAPSLYEKGKFVKILSPFVWLVVLQDAEHKIKGFLWAEINVFEKHIFIQMCSIDKKYQSASNVVSKEITNYLFNLPIDKKYKSKIVMATAHPKVFERYGWKKRKRVLMEIENAVSENTETNDKSQ